MRETDLLPDDPKLTAYALGELEGDERAAVEAALRARPELRAEVEAIRALAGRMEAALAGETAERGESETAAGNDDGGAADGAAFGADPAGDDEVGGEAAVTAGGRAGPYDGGRRARPFPLFYYVSGGLAAAGLAVLVAWNRDEVRPRASAGAERVAVAAAATSVGGALRPVEIEIPLEEVAAAVQPGPGRGVGGAAAELPLLRQVRHEDPETALRRPAAAATAGAGREDGGDAVVVEVRSAAGAERATEESGGTRATLAATLPVGVPAGTETPGQERPAATGPAGGDAAVEHAPAAALAATVAAPAMPAVTFAVPAANPEAELPRPEERFAAGRVELFPGGQRVFAPPVAGATPGMRYAHVPADNDVVLLETFTVTAERVSYGAAKPLRRWSGPEPWVEERDWRPRAPAGARFGRAPTEDVRDNPFVETAREPRSSFAAEAEAASYLTVRRAIARRELPPREAVKIEELLNYFPYGYSGPGEERALTFWQKLRGEDGAPPFAAAMEVAAAPWAPGHRLVRIGLKGREMPAVERPAANLVFLIDVSNSMQEPNKLPLVKESLRLLVARLRPEDKVAIVTYGGRSGLALASTPVARSREILTAIDALVPVGGETGGAGIRLAYGIAREAYAADGINRVILCTDGDFALGTASEAELLRLAEERAAGGVFLTVLGFGLGQYRDPTLELLARRGRGSHGYIDSRGEAHKLLVEQTSSTLATIAKDVKLQVEFDPAQVAQYRLIGYENRLLRREDFAADDVGGGEIAAGHTVTALYEIVPAPGAAERTDRELATVTVRYRKPGGVFTRKAVYGLRDGGMDFAAATADFRFAAAVAQYGMMLRHSPYRGQATLDDVIGWAAGAADDPRGFRGEFIDLARATRDLWRGE